METKETRGARIKRLREDKGLSQLEVGTKVGTTKAAVSKWEAAAAPDIGLEAFFKLADLFDIDPRELALGVKTQTTTALTLEQRQLLANYDKLPDDLRFTLAGMAQSLVTALDVSYSRWSFEEKKRAEKRDGEPRRKPVTSR